MHDTNKTGEQSPALSCSGCVDEFRALHDDLGIANCGVCIRNATIKDYYHPKDDYFETEGK